MENEIKAVRMKRKEGGDLSSVKNLAWKPQSRPMLFTGVFRNIR